MKNKTTILHLILISLTVLTGTVCRAVAPFELQWMNNPEKSVYKSSDHKDGIFVIEAYFRDCTYCNKNAPRVNALAEKFKNEPRVQVLDVGVDSQDSTYAEWIQKHKPNHPVLKDAKGEKLVKSQLGTTGYPSTYVIDCNGNVVATTRGVWSSSSQGKIERAIEDLLSENCSAP
jgi:peroxiredoxin